MTNKKIGLALGSGAWRGLAHIGVIKSLLENNIPIDFIAGSSIGSIVGGIYATTGDIKKVEKIAKELNLKKITSQFLKKTIGDVKIENTKIPFCAVGSDLLTGELVEIKNGSLAKALKASSAIPVIFKPIKMNNEIIFDGGMISPVPTKVVRNMGADIVIGVNLYGGIFPISKNLKLNRIKSGKLSRFLSLKKLSEIDLESADISIELKIPNDDYSFFAKFLNNQETIDHGYDTTQKLIPQIQKLLNN